MKTDKTLHDVKQAAAYLQLTPDALTARCRRVARKEGRDVVARLGAGVVGLKLGRTWRFLVQEVPS